MPTVYDVLDKVDPDLIKLLDANEKFATYRKIAPSTTTSSTIAVVHGSLGLDIDNRKVMGLTISSGN
ncbi:hypothetical protein [Agrobacterium tumefaciens]|uniref:hypothetical protein n=1 Tax=Agrobacterium tumefaciens TaxID=358 RepID=UPI00278A639B|nr:hypothetical protein [Agrobacterium tumefaciens]MDP9787475.1 hypothetical protein [Agrobacterium tumefaciens]